MVGVVLILIAIFGGLLEYRSRTFCMATVDGYISEIREVKDVEGHSYEIYVAYQVEGQGYIHKARVRGPAWMYDEGKTHLVYYDPEDPSRCQLQMERTGYAAAFLIIFIIGVIMTAMFLFSLGM